MPPHVYLIRFTMPHQPQGISAPLVARIALFVSKLMGSFEAICFDPNIMWPLRFAFGVVSKKLSKMSPRQIGTPKERQHFLKCPN